MWVIPAAGRFIAAHWVTVVLVAIGIAIVVAIELCVVRKKRPKDSAGNGIMIGQAKAFDNRSLAIKVERLSAGLENLKIINQNVTDNPSTFQQKTTSEESRTLSFVGKVSKPAQSGDQSGTTGDAQTKPAPGAEGELKPPIGLAAGDLLSDRLNLASQIFNLQLLYERSLSDRMIGDDSRLQTVLGFQVSITPPSGYEDCAAVTEVAVRVALATPALPPGVAPGAPSAAAAPAPVTPAAPPPAGPFPPVAPPVAASATAAGHVSLVALMPQERTYNAESISTSERSIEGSAIARVLTIGFSRRRGTRQLFVHRDSDTVAFERELAAAKNFLDGAAMFGWELRPVLGRRTVSAGTRQMLAVVAIPVADSAVAAESVLEIRTRSYWRYYDRKRQTSAPNWSWWPWKIDRSAESKSAVYKLPIPNTAKIQGTLSAKLSGIQWVNSGDGKATVVVRGSNFFSGTKVVIGGTVHQEENRTLTLKSDQALEFQTTIESLALGDAVLSCRYGPSFQLTLPSDQRRAAALAISRATIRPQRKSKAFRLSVDITGFNELGQAMPFTVADVQALPDPILFVGAEAVSMPYDYIDVESADPNTAGPSRVRVEAWVTAKTLAKSLAVSFRVPFCGFEYQTSQPLSFSEPSVVRMGGDATHTVFRIFYPQGFGGLGSSLTVDLDRTYVGGDANSPDLARMSDTEYRLRVMTDTVSRYQNMVVRVGSGEPYLVPIPPTELPQGKATIDAGAKPPVMKKGDRGPLEWAGVGLGAITDVSVVPPVVAGQPVSTPVPQQFTVYADGTRLLVYLNDGSTTQEGKLTLECTISPQDKLSLQVFVTA